MKRHLALAVSITTAATMGLSACGGSDSKTTTTSASTSTSSAIASSPSSEVGEPSAPSSTSSSAASDKLSQKMADCLGVKPEAAWSATGSLETTTAKTALVTDDQAMTAYRLSDGSKVWSNGFNHPPADVKITDPQQEKVTTLGSSVLVAWSGTAPGGGLEPATDVSVVALYDIDTGKQIGKAHTFDEKWGEPRIQSSDVRATTMTYRLPWEDMFYPDGTVRHVEMPDNSDDVLGGPATRLVTVTKDRALLAGTSRSSSETVIALTNGSGSARIGSPLECDMGQPAGRVEGADQDRSDFLYSPNQQWAVWGQALINLKTGQNRCLSGLSSAKVEPIAVTDAGDVWGAAGDKTFTLKQGAAKPTIVPGVPNALVPGGIVVDVKGHISKFTNK